MLKHVLALKGAHVPEKFNEDHIRCASRTCFAEHCVLQVMLAEHTWPQGLQYNSGLHVTQPTPHVSSRQKHLYIKI